MDSLLSSLTSPIAIGVILIVLVLLVAVPLILRRRQATPEEEPPDLGTPIDYTSLPVDETPGLRDRFNNLSLAGKILVFVVPVLVIVAIIVLLLLLPPSNNIADIPPTPTLVPAITITDAGLARARPNQQIEIEADSTLPIGTEVTAELLVDGEPFTWYAPETATTTVGGNGVILLTLSKAENAPEVSEGTTVNAVLTAMLGEEQQIVSNQQEIIIPQIYADDFYGETVAVVPTETPTSEPEPTEESAPEEPSEPTAAPTETVNPISGDLVATVFNGGNVRQQPLLIDNVIGQLNGGEQVEIIGRTPNGEWYRIRNERGVVGWASITLLSVAPEVAQRVPLLPIVTVFTSGNIYGQPQAQGSIIGQVFRSETVDLLAKTPAGDWYKVTSVRNETGWVDASLLGIPPEVADIVPNEGQSAPATTEEPTETPSTEDNEETPAVEDTPEPADEPPSEGGSAAAPPAEPVGLIARVFSNGSVRDLPDTNAEVLGEINAGEDVELLQKTPNGTWYRIKSDTGIEGWVSSRLLTVDPQVQDRVPV